MVKIYLVSTAITLISSLFAAHRWHNEGMENPRLLLPGILSIIPIVQWMWFTLCLTTIVVGEDTINKVK